MVLQVQVDKVLLEQMEILHFLTVEVEEAVLPRLEIQMQQERMQGSSILVESQSIQRGMYL